jgi:hypothetical protein
MKPSVGQVSILTVIGASGVATYQVEVGRPGAHVDRWACRPAVLLEKELPHGAVVNEILGPAESVAHEQGVGHSVVRAVRRGAVECGLRGGDRLSLEIEVVPRVVEEHIAIQLTDRRPRAKLLVAEATVVGDDVTVQRDLHGPAPVRPDIRIRGDAVGEGSRDRVERHRRDDRCEVRRIQADTVLASED